MSAPRALAEARGGLQSDAVLARAALSLACALLVGCAPSGEDPRSRTSRWEAASGAYRVHYLEPPWELTGASGDEAFLRIRSNAMNAAGLDGGPAKYELRVSRRPGTPEALAAAEVGALTAAGVEIVATPRGVETDDGVGGVEVVGRLDAVMERSHRVAFFPLAGGGECVRLAFEATPALDEPEVDAMIALLEIGPLEP